MVSKSPIEPSPLIGILVIGLIGLGLSAPTAELRDSASGQQVPAPSSCAYMLYRDEACMGTVFVDKPAKLAAILAVRGFPLAASDSNPLNTFPCESCLKVNTAAGTTRCEPIGGRQILILDRPIELNRACKEDLTAIPGIGPKLSEKIVNYRRFLGRFSSVEDLSMIPGLGPKRMNAIRPLVEVRSPAASPESVCPCRSVSP
jgi:competence ComEA-like helix-hairpin-helix protein